MHKEIQFPIGAASAIRRRKRREFFDSALATDEEVEHLLTLLYREPEVTMFSFHPEGGPMNSHLLAAERLGRLQVIETQRSWYEHPERPGNFVRVTDAEFDWQRELSRTGKKLLRNELSLTEQEKRRREIEDTAAAVARASQPTPKSLWERLEHHYRRNSAAYYGVGLLLAVAGLLVAV